ncbi:MAG: hypothetical protein K9M99_05780 [Candidatus Cloacimonetes bacterium]|nr:hypothetical protein [Candidatus Cloacimonadota bacterium]
MKKPITGLLLIILLLLAATASGYNYYSPLWRTEIIAADQPVELAEKPVIEGSVTVMYQGEALQDSIDYMIDYQKGIVKFKNIYKQVQIEYAVFPRELRQRYFNYAEIEIAGRDSLPELKRQSRKEYRPLELVVKGNKTVSISVADNEDFQLDQSLFLRISGKLSDNVNIQAQVSDSESPITPEGDSREISSLDQIFIRVFGRRYELGFGDLEHQFLNTEFLAFTAYFEGVKARWGDKSRITAGAALSKAQNATIELSGIDGRQGPYWLSNDYGGEALIVAGSETVYLDGSEQQRGDDYTIDYAEGSITFTEEHFISSSDRIYVEYQYSDETYRQQVYLQDSEWEISDNFVLGSAVYYREDDADNPLKLEFNDSDLDSLQQAGDESVFGSGIYETDAGLGAYIKSIEGYYQYVGLDSTGTYNLSFYPQSGGDYILADNGNYYIFVGSGNGDFALGVELEAPESQGNYTLWSKWTLGELELRGEGMLSSDDRNTLSKLDDADNLGWAGSAGIKYEKQEGLIKPHIKLKWRGKTAELFSFVPLDEAEYLYETDALPDTLGRQEYSLTGGADVQGVFFPQFVLRKVTAGSEYSSRYLAGSGRTKQSGYLPESNYRYLTWSNKTAAGRIEFSSHSGMLAYTAGKFKLGYEMVREIKDAVLEEYNKTKDLGYLELATEGGSSRIYWEQVAIDSVESPIRKISTTTGIRSRYKTGRQQLEIELAHREVQDSVKVGYDLAKLTYNGSLGKMISLGAKYRIRNLEFYPRVRELVYIGNEEGNYNEDGEEDENGDYNWQVVSIDYAHPQKSIELTSSALVNIKPAKPLSEFWQRMRLELDGAVNEQSTTDNIHQLYLLNSSELQQKDTTVYGRQSLKGRWWYDILKNKLTLRLMKEDETRLDNRYQDSESVNISSEEAYLRWKYNKQQSYEFFIEHRQETDTRYDSELENYELACESRSNLRSQVNYSLRLEYGWEDGSDSSQEINYKLSKWEVVQTLNWFPRRTSRMFVRFKYRYNEREGEESAAWQEEKRAGEVMIWNASYDYKLNNYMKLSIEYKGDKYPREESSHEFRMEVAAEF